MLCVDRAFWLNNLTGLLWRSVGKEKARAVEMCGHQGVGDSSREEQDCLKESLAGVTVRKSSMLYFLPLANLTANCGGQTRGASLGVSVGQDGWPLCPVGVVKPE